MGWMNNMEVFKDIIKNTADSVKFIGDDYLIQISDVIVTTIEKNKKILVIGLNESSADAHHISTELTNIYKPNHAPIKSISLNSVLNSPSVDNDESVDKFITTWGEAGDVLIVLSSDLDSEYVAGGVELAKSLGINTITLSSNNSDLVELSDYPIEIASSERQIIENAYMIVMHFICNLVERGMFNADRKSKYRR